MINKVKSLGKPAVEDHLHFPNVPRADDEEHMLGMRTWHTEGGRYGTHRSGA